MLLIRYLSGRFIKMTMALYISLLALYLVITVAQQLFGGGSMFSLTKVFLFVLYGAPMFLLPLTYVVLFISTLLTMRSLMITNEIDAMRTAGLSIKKMIVIIATIAVGTSIAFSFVGGEFFPVLNGVAVTIKSAARKTSVSQKTSAMRDDAWLKKTNGLYHISKLGLNKLTNLTIFKYNPSNESFIVSHVNAAIYKQGRWVASKLDDINLSDPRQLVVSHAKNIPINFSIHDLDSRLSKKVLDAQANSHLRARINYDKKNHVRTAFLEAALWARYFQPLYTLLLIIVAVLLACEVHQRAGRSIDLLVGIPFVVLLFFLDMICQWISVRSHVDPFFLCLLPLVAFSFIGYVLLKFIKPTVKT